MKVYLTFDIEIWCNGWTDLDRDFPSCFQRYVYGRSKAGDYALPKILEIMRRHGLKGVFFVEPLFAARFGLQYLATIVDLIGSEGHDLQLHLHPEWTDEIRPLPIPGATRKRQHLCFYTADEQTVLIKLARDLLIEAGCAKVGAFRAGSFACNADTYRALHDIGIGIDSSLHALLSESGNDLRKQIDVFHPLEYRQIQVFPMTIFRDGTGRLRPAQLGSCSFAEMREAMEGAARNKTEHFVVLSHNFEMLKRGHSDPDNIVVARFERLCAYLEQHRDAIEVTTLTRSPLLIGGPPYPDLAKVGLAATLRRHGEQAVRRLFG